MSRRRQPTTAIPGSWQKASRPCGWACRRSWLCARIGPGRAGGARGMPERLLWLVPESRGGIHSYSRDLWPSIRDACRAEGIEPLEPLFLGEPAFDKLIARLDQD